jgi:hypothetical protein
MKPLPNFLRVWAFFVCIHSMFGQNADIPPPDARIALVARVAALAESRGKAVVLPENLVNPFTGVVREQTVVEVAIGSIPVGLSGPELLSQLAATIPSTGTLVFGGNAMLLLGPKKVKVGEKIPVSFEGKDYQLTLTAVTPTTFTVQLGKELSTRTVRKR